MCSSSGRALAQPGGIGQTWTMPKMMRAAFIRRYGDNDAIQVGPRPVPRVGPRAVLIEVHAACVNPRDWLLRDGRYVFRHLVVGFPKILGSDVAGTVLKRGPLVRGLEVGDEVYGMQTTFGQMGAYAEYMSVYGGVVARKPKTASFAEAAGLPVAGLTALQGLRDDLRVRSGERVAVIGASGGVGHYAVQIARHMGAEVIGVCSEANEALVSELGADRTIDYRSCDVTRELDGLGGVDVVYDAIGKGSLERYRACLRAGGRYLSTVPTVDNALDQVLSIPTRRLSDIAETINLPLPPSSKTVLVRPNREDLDELARLVDAGVLTTHIDSVYPLAEVKDALARSRSQRTRGKIILQVK